MLKKFFNRFKKKKEENVILNHDENAIKIDSEIDSISDEVAVDTENTCNIEENDINTDESIDNSV